MTHHSGSPTAYSGRVHRVFMLVGGGGSGVGGEGGEGGRKGWRGLIMPPVLERIVGAKLNRTCFRPWA